MRPVHYNPRQRAKRERRQRPFVEFSKKALTAMIVLWFLGAVVMIGVVIVQLIRGDYMISTGDLTMYFAAPLTGGVLGYMLKSAMDHRDKNKGGIPPQEDRSI